MKTPYFLIYATMTVLVLVWLVLCANFAHYSIAGTITTFILSLPIFFMISIPFMAVAGIVQGEMDS